MIPNKSKDVLINKIRAGYAILEACKLSGISKPTLYQHLKTDKSFKAVFDKTVFYARTKIDSAKAKVQEKRDEKNWEDLKKIVLKKR